MSDVVFTDNSQEVIDALTTGIDAALEAIGNNAVSHAKENLTAAGRVNTGNLRNSVSHLVDEQTVYIGTNVSYGIYVEMGTGIYIEGGRRTPWAYQDEEGNWHRTRGMAPSHFLRNAAQDHVSEYQSIAEAVIKQHQP